MARKNKRDAAGNGPGKTDKDSRRKRRRLKLTREGKYFVFITIAVGLAAINTGNNLLYLVLGWLLSVIVASGLMSDASLRKISLDRRPPPRVHATVPFLMELILENGKKYLSSFSVEVEDLVAGKPIDKKCYFLKVPPGRTQRTSYRHTFSRRGLYKLDGFRVGSKFPFALFLKTRHLQATDELLVLPAVRPVPQPPPRARNLGEAAVNQAGRYGDFFGLREYREGDDRRDVHWRSTARTGRTMVREYEQEAQRRATIVVDNALPMGAGPALVDALEEAVSLAASLANTYISRGYTVSVVARGGHVPLGAGPNHLVRVLKFLALLPTTEDDEPFSGTLDPATDTVMVVPRGAQNEGLPTGIGHVMEAP